MVSWGTSIAPAPKGTATPLFSMLMHLTVRRDVGGALFWRKARATLLPALRVNRSSFSSIAPAVTTKVSCKTQLPNSNLPSAAQVKVGTLFRNGIDRPYSRYFVPDVPCPIQDQFASPRNRMTIVACRQDVEIGLGCGLLPRSELKTGTAFAISFAAFPALPEFARPNPLRCFVDLCVLISYGSSGGARRNRTDDLFNAIEALSQLSYGPTFRECRAASIGAKLYGARAAV